MAPVSKGDQVAIHFTGRLEDGTVFDTTENRDPLQFEAGGEQVLPGLSDAVIGMEEGEEKSVTITAEEGFGIYDPEKTQEVPLSELPDGVKVGDQLRAEAGDQVFRIWVREVNEEAAILDGNHPLAGKQMIFDLQVVPVSPAE